MNNGNDAPIYKGIDEEQPYFIYEIGPSGGLVPFGDFTNGSDDLFYQIVTYGKPGTPSKYGSMIRIS